MRIHSYWVRARVSFIASEMDKSSDATNATETDDRRSDEIEWNCVKPTETARALRTASRRTFLQGAATTCLAGLGLAAGGTASASSGPATSYDDEYDTVVNVVEAGADNTGNEPITSVLRSVRSDNTLLYFPPGRYYMDSQFRFTGFEKFGVVGNDATLVPANYYNFDGPRYRLFRLGTRSSPGGHVRFEGFEVDQTAPDTGIRVIDTYAEERLEVRDVRIRGEHDSGTWGPGHFNITSESGTGIVERFRAPDGGAWVHNTPNDGNAWRGPIGIEANQNKGRLEFRRCWMHGFPSHGIYASGGSGQIIVNGGWFKNNNPVNIRVGGTNSKVIWPQIENDHARPDDQSHRGIRLENGSGFEVIATVRNSVPMPGSHAIAVMNSCESATIHRSTIEISGDQVNHGIVVSPSAGEVLIEDTEITHSAAGGYPIWIRGEDSRDRVQCRFVSIDGEAGDEAGFRDAIRCTRNNCRFSACELSQRALDGVDRNGLVVEGTDTTVYQGSYRAERFPYVDQGADNAVLQSDMESFRSDVEAVRVYPDVVSPEFKSNRLVNGIQDLGAIGLLDWRNTSE